jgi:hypothetical protein
VWQLSGARAVVAQELERAKAANAQANFGTNTHEYLLLSSNYFSNLLSFEVCLYCYCCMATVLLLYGYCMATVLLQYPQISRAMWLGSPSNSPKYPSVFPNIPLGPATCWTSVLPFAIIFRVYGFARVSKKNPKGNLKKSQNRLY